VLEATILQWFKRNEQVKVGDVLVELGQIRSAWKSARNRRYLAHRAQGREDVSVGDVLGTIEEGELRVHLSEDSEYGKRPAQKSEEEGMACLR
jgi:hypothetical protein